MAYLLTEIALEMLGYQYYDDNGEPCAMTLEGVQIPQSPPALPLVESIEIKFVEHEAADVARTSNTNENAIEINTVELTNAASFNSICDQIRAIANSESKKENIINNAEITSDTESESETKTRNDLKEDDVRSAGISKKPSNNDREKPSTSATTAAVPNQSSSPPNALTAEMPPLELTLKNQLEEEILKSMLDLKREKCIYYNGIGADVKTNLESILQVVSKYRKTQMANLQKELQKLVDMRQRVENLTSTTCPGTYLTYLLNSNALSSETLLSSTEILQLLKNV